jgi:hypothetical protein
MSCQKYESIINELAREQIMEMTVRSEALEHCEKCEECARKLKEQRSLTTALRSLASELQTVTTTDTVPAALIAALHDGATTTQVGSNRRQQYWVAAAAAALLIFFAVGAMRLRRPAVDIPLTKAPQVATTDQPQEPVKSATPLPSPPAKEQKRPRQEKETKRSKPLRPSDREAVASLQSPATTSTANYEPEIATEFLPLGYDHAMNLQDGGQIMRVEVPRSTLASFGLPINMNRAGQRVKADLLVGWDGSARAIRFVQ